MLTLNDGRSELWQWDTGRTLAVDADCSQVHFSNKVLGRSIDVDVIDGVAIIPDILLQTDKDLNVWAFVGTAENGYTKISKTFKVNRRNKPADYVFTPPDQTTLAELEERLGKLEESQDPDSIKNAVEDYLAQNPVEAPVQSVNGQTGTVELNAEDVGAIAETQLQTAINTALAQAKASGEFDGADGESGGWYTPAVTQPNTNTMRVAFTPSKEGMPDVDPKDITLPFGGGGGGSGGSGEDGGYYTPVVTQPTENTMQVAFTPSKAAMPAVPGKAITLPAGAKGDKGDKGDKGADGKSAYQYAQEGGYTGTEADFAAKLAAEMPTTLPNPNALTFTGAVTGSYDGSAPLTVEIPSGGGAAVETWDLLINAEIAEDCTEVIFNSGDAGEVLSNYKELLLLIDLFGNTGGFTTALKIGFLNAVKAWNSPYALNMAGYSADTVKYYINMFRFKKTEYGILPVNRYTQYNTGSLSNGLYNTGSISSSSPQTDFMLPISKSQHVTTDMTDFTSQKEFERLGIAGYQAVIGAGTIIKVWGVK